MIFERRVPLFIQNANWGHHRSTNELFPSLCQKTTWGNLTVRKHCKLTTCHVGDAGAAVTPTSCGLGDGEASAGFEIRALPMENNGLLGILQNLHN